MYFDFNFIHIQAVVMLMTVERKTLSAFLAIEDGFSLFSQLLGRRHMGFLHLVKALVNDQRNTAYLKAYD
ncbi:hypothetical protein MUP51_02155 [Candidatus Bathyarchaeota archaeon]|nr:hypothetical protein [Candidatus Bathyarchaeota archaeon]